jgi:AAA+ ATPase superfamily predicted ATPase
MLNYLYPTDERMLFTDRQYHLGLLEMCRTELEAGRRKHLSFIGLRRIGKTLILKEFILRLLQQTDSAPSVIPIYLDLQRTGLSPEFFATEYIGAALYWFQERGQGRPDTYTDPATQLRVATTLGKPQTLDTLLQLDQALRQRSIPHRRLIEWAFEFPEILAAETDTRFLIILDEFQEITRLSNYPQVDDALEIFRAVLQTQSHVAYVVAGSAISLMERIFHHASSPLFVHFRSELVGPFTREDTAQLAHKVLSSQPLPETALRTLFTWTYGHPFYVYAVTERMREMTLLFNRDVDDQLLREAFVLETLSTTGRIYNLCRYVVEESIAQARGQTLLRLVLRLLAQGPEPPTLTELSHRLKRATGTTRNLLNRLIEVDLVVQRDDTFDLRDPVLKVWLGYFHAGVELLTMPRREILEQLVADMSERFQRVSSELGLAKESQVRELIDAFASQKVSGEFFGQSGPFLLPTFQQIAPYQSSDGRVELDAVASGDALWVVEVKWKNQPASRADLNRFLQNVHRVEADLPGSPDALWFIAKSGFKDSALRLARQKGILISNRLDLQALAERLGVRFAK